MCVCARVCVCVCERLSHTERKTGGERKGKGITLQGWGDTLISLFRSFLNDSNIVAFSLKIKGGPKNNNNNIVIIIIINKSDLELDVHCF